MCKGSFWLRLQHTFRRYFCVMPAEVVPGPDAVRAATEANKKAVAANTEAGLRLLDELDALSGMIRHEGRE